MSSVVSWSNQELFNFNFFKTFLSYATQNKSAFIIVVHEQGVNSVKKVTD